MKYVLIIGKSSEGKSTAIDEVCRQLTPSVAWHLNSKKSFERLGPSHSFFVGTYLLEVDEKKILIVAGAPTEQNVTITEIIKISLEFVVMIDFAVVAMRTREIKEGFQTASELENFGECLLTEWIEKVDGVDFKNNPKWQSRIKKILDLLR